MYEPCIFNFFIKLRMVSVQCSHDYCTNVRSQHAMSHHGYKITPPDAMSSSWRSYVICIVIVMCRGTCTFKVPGRVIQYVYYTYMYHMYHTYYMYVCCNTRLPVYTHYSLAPKFQLGGFPPTYAPLICHNAITPQ